MTPITHTIFRTFKEWPCEVIAVFPHEPGTTCFGSNCMTYMHTGQHGIGDVALCGDGVSDYCPTRPSTEEELAPLKAELESSGYRIKVRKTVTQNDNRRRYLAYDRSIK